MSGEPLKMVFVFWVLYLNFGCTGMCLGAYGWIRDSRFNKWFPRNSSLVMTMNTHGIQSLLVSSGSEPLALPLGWHQRLDIHMTQPKHCAIQCIHHEFRHIRWLMATNISAVRYRRDLSAYHTIIIIIPMGDTIRIILIFSDIVGKPTKNRNYYSRISNTLISTNPVIRN